MPDAAQTNQEANMAIIQMIDNEVHDVTQSGSEIEDQIREAGKYPVPVLKLELAANHGGGAIWINANAIASFMG
jgi:hypothetical protein